MWVCASIKNPTWIKCKARHTSFKWWWWRCLRSSLILNKSRACLCSRLLAVMRQTNVPFALYIRDGATRSDTFLENSRNLLLLYNRKLCKRRSRRRKEFGFNLHDFTVYMSPSTAVAAAHLLSLAHSHRVYSEWLLSTHCDSSRTGVREKKIQVQVYKRDYGWLVTVDNWNSSLQSWAFQC
jgi:hypothetical protein